jgi:hypothetical protein
MFEPVVIVHAEEHYRDLLREAEVERLVRHAGPVGAVRHLMALVSTAFRALALA